jgi:hypothetical protein
MLARQLLYHSSHSASHGNLSGLAPHLGYSLASKLSRLGSLPLYLHPTHKKGMEAEVVTVSGQLWEQAFLK